MPVFANMRAINVEQYKHKTSEYNASYLRFF
jgi:hypothetical protein